MRERGFTLIEILVVLAVVALLAVVVLAALQNARSKGRYAQMLHQMSIIGRSAEAYRNDTGSHAAEVAVGVAPDFVVSATSKWLQEWPDTPCKTSGLWRYDWDNTGYVRVTIDHYDGVAWAPVYAYCIVRASGQCRSPIEILGGVQEINTKPSGGLAC